MAWNKRIGTSFINHSEYCKHTFSTKSTSPRLSEEDGNQKISFIEKARAMGANALLGLYTHTGDRFDQCLKDLKILEIGDGKVKCIIPVEKHLHNANRNLHGGAICTLVDVVGTLALLGKDPTKPGVSVDLNVNFLRAGMPNEDIYIAKRGTGPTPHSPRRLRSMCLLTLARCYGTFLTSHTLPPPA